MSGKRKKREKRRRRRQNKGRRRKGGTTSRSRTIAEPRSERDRILGSLHDPAEDLQLLELGPQLLEIACDLHLEIEDDLHLEIEDDLHLEIVEIAGRRVPQKMRASSLLRRSTSRATCKCRL